MPKWLKWFLIAFFGINILATIAGIPNPFNLLYEGLTSSQLGSKTLDGGLAGLSIIMGIGSLILWGIVAVIMYFAMRGKPKAPVPPIPGAVEADTPEKQQARSAPEED